MSTRNARGASRVACVQHNSLLTDLPCETEMAALFKYLASLKYGCKVSRDAFSTSRVAYRSTTSTATMCSS